MKWIPAARSKQWIVIAGGSSLLVSLMLVFIRFLLFAQPFSSLILFRFILLAVGLSACFSLVGWLGARFIWLCSNIGLILGLAAMALYAQERTGWEDLISFLNFLLLLFGGIVLGILVEVIYFVVRRLRKS